MTNDKTFKSSKEYSLKYIFFGNNKIIIPDLQRDYCWGDKAWDKDKKEHTELVTTFVKNLIDLFNKNKNDEITLGLLYGYEELKHHIQLCDGQQRITTLFLLLGMLNRKVGDNIFKEHLISAYELDEGDKEPYLQYAIRESTLYFLSDLVCEFFLNNKDIPTADIKNQKWYFEEYELDASIQSMIAAIKKIEKILSEQQLDYKEFGNFILQNLKMIYYDMKTREQGEKTFVVINTTGEPLTATENLKPILIGHISDEEKREQYSEAWEEREEWFWKNRGKNATADDGVNEFFRWVKLLEYDIVKWKKEVNDNSWAWDNWQNNLPLPKIETIETVENSGIFEILNEYFEIVQFLFENDYFNFNKEYLTKRIDMIHLFQLLPVIKYVKHFGKEICERNIKRVIQFFKNLANIEDISKNISRLLPESIFLINKLTENDIASIHKQDSKQLLTTEEKRKFELYLDPSNDREKLEDKFWKAEDHPIWKAEINPLIDWATDNEKFNVDEFDRYNDAFNKLFAGDISDLTRRALLTRNLKGYPRFFKGYTNYSFCSEPSHWKILIKDNIREIKEFLDILINANINFEDTEERLIKEYDDKKNDFYDFIHNKELLEYCHKKIIQKEGKDWILIQEIKRKKFIYLKTYLLYLELKEMQEKGHDFFSNWEIDTYPTWHTAYLKKGSVYIDVFYTKNDLYQLQLFKNDESSDSDIIDIAKKENLEEYLEQKEKRHKSKEMSKDEILFLLERLVSACTVKL
jgi:uncharacterized protein with ParB-like and HNH nuclease domain